MSEPPDYSKVYCRFSVEVLSIYPIFQPNIGLEKTDINVEKRTCITKFLDLRFSELLYTLRRDRQTFIALADVASFVELTSIFSRM